MDQYCSVVAVLLSAFWSLCESSDQYPTSTVVALQWSLLCLQNHHNQSKVTQHSFEIWDSSQSKAQPTLYWEYVPLITNEILEGIFLEVSAPILVSKPWPQHVKLSLWATEYGPNRCMSPSAISINNSAHKFYKPGFSKKHDILQPLILDSTRRKCQCFCLTQQRDEGNSDLNLQGGQEED